MFSFFGKKPAVSASESAATGATGAQSAATAATATATLATGERYDSTLRPVCFGLPNKVTKEAAAKVGPENFKKYEYLLYIGAQLSRLVYCDTGIMWYAIEKSLGMSNDIVNKVITTYDTQFASKRRISSTTPGSEGGRPMESYALTISQRSGNKYATYISTPSDLTCLVLKASKVKANPNSILQASDVFVSFKGSSTLKNLWHDLKSQFTASDLGGLLESIGVKVTMNEGKNLLTGAFVKPIVKAWSTLMEALTEHITADESRLFLCGHSLGGAYCTLFAFILAEGKVSGTIPIMSKVKSIHILSYGAPTLLSDTARNTFNRHLESGLMTIDRVVSQKIAARTSAVALTQALALGAGPNDIIPSIPAGFAHPGFRPLATEFRPEANGRPYSMDNIRKFYGVSSNTRYRDPATWPFLEDIGLGDRKNSAALNQIVKTITNLEPPPDVDPAQEIAAAENEARSPVAQLGGFGEQKGIYSAATKNHIPDYISVAGSNYAVGFAHAEYLGMFFLGGFRLAGMKNPGYGNRTANFSMYDSGVELAYVDYKVNPALDAVPEARLPAEQSDSDESAATGAATTVTTAVTRGGYRRHRTRKATKVRKAMKMKSSRRR
jgi:hypothetical protein